MPKTLLRPHLDLVLIRGIMSSSEHWWDFVPTLKSYFPTTVIETPDIPGNGHQHKVKTPLSAKKNVSAMRAQLSSSNKKILIGFSLGGMLALEWAQHHPEEVEGVILINSSLSGNSVTRRFRPKSFLKVVLMGLERDHLKREHKVLNITTHLLGHKRNEVIQKFAEIEKKHPTQPLNFIRQLAVARQVALHSHKPDCPTLILNSKKDQVVHHACSHQIAKEWSAEVRVHDDAGHDLTLDAPHWVANELKHWFKDSGWLLEPTKSAISEQEYIQDRPSLHP